MWLTIILAAALLLRVALLPAPGNGFDIRINEGWALSAVIHGTPGSYDKQDFGGMKPNYPPLSLSMFSAVGNTYAALSPTLDRAPLLHSLIKLPSVIADIATSVMLFLCVGRIFGANKGLAAAAIYAFHPAGVSNGAIWGQIDAVHSAFMLGFVIACTYRHWFLAGVLLALGLLSKVQTAMLLPLVVVLTFTSPRSMLLLPCGVLAGMAAVLLPFAWAGHLDDAVFVFTHSVNFYRNVTLNAYNVWQVAFGLGASPSSDDVLVMNMISLRAIGLLLFFLVSAIILWAVRLDIIQKAKEDILSRFAGLSIAASGVSYAFFMLNTQMHERYLHPLVALGIPLIFLRKRWAWIYFLSTALYTINMMSLIGGNPWVQSLMRTLPKGAFTVALAQSVVFVWFIAEALCWRERLKAKRA